MGKRVNPIRINWPKWDKFLYVLGPFILTVLILIWVYTVFGLFSEIFWGTTTVMISVLYFIYFVAIILEPKYFRHPEREKGFLIMWAVMACCAAISSAVLNFGFPGHDNLFTVLGGIIGLTYLIGFIRVKKK